MIGSAVFVGGDSTSSNVSVPCPGLKVGDEVQHVDSALTSADAKSYFESTISQDDHIVQLAGAGDQTARSFQVFIIRHATVVASVTTTTSTI